MNRVELTDLVVKMSSCLLLEDGQATYPNMTAVDWDRMLSIASLQGVLTFISPMLADLKVDDEDTRMIIIDWYSSTMQDRLQYEQQVKTMRELAIMFENDGIDILFFKGASLAQLYPVPSTRVFNDIDFYLFGKFQQGIEVMARNNVENIKFPHHHTQALLNGILLENHYDFVERKTHRSNVILDNALKELAEKEGRMLKASFLGSDIHNGYVMTPTMNAVFLMRHMSIHFVSETISLRMLYDWALFLKFFAKEVNWQLVVDLYDKSKMIAFVGIIQEILRKRVNVAYEGSPVFPVNEKHEERVWESIINPPMLNPYIKSSFKYYIF